jgi:dTDP-6-deoxy-L-talose 4-dehydrogenase (NAD+)
MKKILVTGATGFIGPYVIEALLHAGCKVIASSSNAGKAAAQPWFKDVKYVSFNFEDFDDGIDYYEFFGRPDKMIHLAWEGLPNYKEAFHVEVNLPRHQLLLGNLLRNGLSDLTVTGTCLEYGLQEGCLKEDNAVFPSNPYAVAKNSLRVWLEKEQITKNFHLKWVRLFYMYGDGQNPNSILSQLDRALQNGDTSFNMSGGEQLRDYLPVTLVGDHIARIALQQGVESIINCCSGVPISISQLVEDHLAQKKAIIQLNKGFYPYTNYEPMAFWGDPAKLKQIINSPS